MPCNYLMKLESDDSFVHKIIEGCQSSTIGQAVVKFWLDRHPGVKVSNFEKKTAEENLDRRVRVKHIQGVSIVDELFEIMITRRPVASNPGVQIVNPGITEVTVMVGKSISAEMELIPWFKDCVQAGSSVMNLLHQQE